MSDTFTTVLLAQCALRPNFTPEDALKLSFQACFGAEHLLNDPIGAQRYFETEFSTACPEAHPDEALIEQISPEVCRVNLRVWKRQGLPPLWLFRLFLESAQTGAGLPSEPPTTPSGAPAPCFAQKLADIHILADAGQLPFGGVEWENAAAAYLAGGVRAVHHSDAYRAAHQPAYRLISARYLPLIPLLERLASMPAPAKDCAHVIAIDGRCGGGKSTLAAALCKVLQTEAIAMDDFFLPPALRTPARLAMPGGNVEHERFAAEVLPHLGRSEPFAYRQFSCAKMELSGTRQIGEHNWRVVEGSYSHHPALATCDALRVFVDVTPEVQIARIRARNGEAWAADFTQKWIPMEEAYFAACETRQRADIILDTSPV